MYFKRIILIRCIPLSLKSKARQREEVLLPTLICSYRWRGTSLCVKLNDFSSILQTFHSRVAIFHLWSQMAFLSHISYDTPGFYPLIHGCCIPRASRHWTSRIGKYVKVFLGSWRLILGSRKTISSPLSRMLHVIMEHGNMQWFLPLTSITLTCDILTKLDLITEFGLFTKSREVSICRLNICNGCGSLPTDPVSVGLAYVLMLRPVSPKHVLCPGFEIRASPGSSILLDLNYSFSK